MFDKDSADNFTLLASNEILDLGVGSSFIEKYKHKYKLK